MNKPRIFLGSSGKQAKLLQAIKRGLEDVADHEPWTTTFNPGRSTLIVEPDTAPGQQPRAWDRTLPNVMVPRPT